MRASRWVLLALVLALFAGCKPKVTKADLASEEKHILKVASLYSSFRSKNARPPNNLDELKSYARGLKKDDLANRGIDDLDRAFISPRDNQPYKVVGTAAAKSVGKGGPPMPVVAIYESQGVDGKRMTASGMGGGASEMTDEQIRQYVANP